MTLLDMKSVSSLDENQAKPERFAFIVSYVGALFAGFQEQPKKRTVQGELESAFARILGESAKITSSGRTDAGVHALAQVCHLDLRTEKARQRIRKTDFLLKINAVLPDELAVRQVSQVAPDFHARALALSKTYRYVILMAKHRNPFLEKYVWRLPFDLAIDKMRQAATHLIGEHDFSAFCASDSNAGHKIRTLTRITFSDRNPFSFLALKEDKFLSIEFTGQGFLKQMVRNIVGTLVAVGQNRISPEEIKKILASKDRQKAFVNAPAQGLFLQKVRYKNV